MQTKVKICGITRAEDALLAEELGADFIGLIFAGDSPRKVIAEQAKEIAGQLSKAKPIGVFVEQDHEEIQSIASDVGLWGVQHYKPFENGFDGIVSIYVHRVKDMVDNTPNSADYLLLDAFSEGVFGGTGHSFDWSLIPQNRRDKIFLAGGIGPNNAVKALAQKTYAIDLSSGVESSPGIKDTEKLKLLFETIKESL